MPSYSLDPSNNACRIYALDAARDGVITYSASGNTDATQRNWIERIYEYLGGLLNLRFSRVETAGEFQVNLVAPDINQQYIGQDRQGKIYLGDYDASLPGTIRWTSAHNKQQYGGVEAQRALVKGIAYSMGLSTPNGQEGAPGYNTLNSILSNIPNGDNGSDWGHTVFLTEDDKNSLKEIYGSNKIDAITGTSVTHTQRTKEDLLIGANGQIDTFRLIAKGMNASNKDSIWHDPATGWDWVCDYNIPTIVNFNPDEGDRILIDRRLYIPLNPISPETPTPKKIQINGKTVKTSKYLKKIRIDFVNQGVGDPPAELSPHNTIFNDAGKLMLNVNGAAGGYGPEPVTGNGQLLAFVDIAGSHSTTDFQASWLGLF